MSHHNIKPTEQSCGKWLTAKVKHKQTTSKRIKRQQSINTVVNKAKKPLCKASTLVFPSFVQNSKSCPVKQSKIRKFLVRKPKQSTSSETAKLSHSARIKTPLITFPVKRDISVAQNEYGNVFLLFIY